MSSSAVTDGRHGRDREIGEAASETEDRRATMAVMKSEPLSFTETLERYVQLCRLEEVVEPAALKRALATLEVELLRLAAEAQAAEITGAPLREAVRDFERFPLLARLHNSVEDVVGLDLPPELEDWARRFFGDPPIAAVEGFLRRLVWHAKHDPQPLRRSLCRALLFEGVRVELVLRARWFPSEVYGTGLEDADLDEIAEAQVAWYLETDLGDEPEIRPLQLMVASALEALSHEIELHAFALRNVGRELREVLARRARIEERLASLDVRDAILLRNELAPDLEIQQVSLDLLKERHPVAFGKVKRNALDARLTRLRRRVASEGPSIVRRRGVTLGDLIGDAYRAEGALLPEGSR